MSTDKGVPGIFYILILCIIMICFIYVCVDYSTFLFSSLKCMYFHVLLGSICFPHVESSDSEQQSVEYESLSSELDNNIDDLNE